MSRSVAGGDRWRLQGEQQDAGVLESLIEQVRQVLMAAALIFTFYKARAWRWQKLVEDDKLELGKEARGRPRPRGVQLLRPAIVVLADGLLPRRQHAHSTRWTRSPTLDGPDIGPDSLQPSGGLGERKTRGSANGRWDVFRVRQIRRPAQRCGPTPSRAERGTGCLANGKKKNFPPFGGGDSVRRREGWVLAEKMTTSPPVARQPGAAGGQGGSPASAASTTPDSRGLKCCSGLVAWGCRLRLGLDPAALFGMGIPSRWARARFSLRVGLHHLAQLLALARRGSDATLRCQRRP